MKFSVKNLGPIQEGTISFEKPLTVLVGPNSSGKSYISYLVYGVLQHQVYYSKPSLKTVKFILKNLEEFEAEQYRFRLSNISKLINTALTSTVLNSIKNAIPTFFASKKLQPQLQLEIGDKQLDAFVSNIKNASEQYEYKQHMTQLRIDDNYIYKGEAGWCAPTNDERKAFCVALKEFLSRSLNKVIIKDIYLPTNPSSVVQFFPAERLALGMLSNDEVERKSKKLDKISELLLEDDVDEFSVAEYFRKSRNEEPKYPLAINDYMYFINGLKDLKEQSSKFAFFADEIQSMLMTGKVTVSEYGKIIYTPNPDVEPLSLHLSSSLVKSLSGLIVYFRHEAKEGDTIIIDEPEVNLHPDNQRIVARILAKAVKLGFRLIVSTHSDYIIRELNNLILLDSIYEDTASQEEILKEYRSKGYDESTRLNKDDLAVYYFIDNTIKALPVNEYGFEVSSIDNEVHKLNEATDDFYAKLRELES
jgi:predicted ATP-binding protein involved in virulence